MNEYCEINLLCTCGGFFSNFNAIVSILYLMYGNEDKFNLRLHTGNCYFYKCAWQTFLKGYPIWKKMFKPLTCNNLDREKSKKIYFRMSKKYTKGTGVKGCLLSHLWKEPFSNNPRIPLTEQFLKLKEKNLNVDCRKYSTYINPYFNKLRNSVNKIFEKNLIPNDWLQDKIDKLYKQHFNDNETYYIGVHIRGSFHFKLDNIGTKKIIKNFITEINKIIENKKKYKIFVATILEPVLKIFKKTYKDNVIFNEFNRINNINADWNRNSKPIKECTNVYLDAICLSKCGIILGGPSNIFQSALFLNNKNKFIIPKVLQIKHLAG